MPGSEWTGSDVGLPRIAWQKISYLRLHAATSFHPSITGRYYEYMQLPISAARFSIQHDFQPIIGPDHGAGILSQIIFYCETYYMSTAYEPLVVQKS